MSLVRATPAVRAGALRGDGVAARPSGQSAAGDFPLALDAAGGDAATTAAAGVAGVDTHARHSPARGERAGAAPAHSKSVDHPPGGGNRPGAILAAATDQLAATAASGDAWRSWSRPQTQRRDESGALAATLRGPEAERRAAPVAAPGSALPEIEAAAAPGAIVNPSALPPAMVENPAGVGQAGTDGKTEKTPDTPPRRSSIEPGLRDPTDPAPAAKPPGRSAEKPDARNPPEPIAAPPLGAARPHPGERQAPRTAAAKFAGVRRSEPGGRPAAKPETHQIEKTGFAAPPAITDTAPALAIATGAAIHGEAPPLSLPDGSAPSRAAIAALPAIAWQTPPGRDRVAPLAAAAAPPHAPGDAAASARASFDRDPAPAAPDPATAEPPAPSRGSGATRGLGGLDSTSLTRIAGAAHDTAGPAAAPVDQAPATPALAVNRAATPTYDPAAAAPPIADRHSTATEQPRADPQAGGNPAALAQGTPAAGEMTDIPVRAAGQGDDTAEARNPIRPVAAWSDHPPMDIPTAPAPTTETVPTFPAPNAADLGDRLLPQVIGSLTHANPDRDVVVRLHPPELGDLTIRVVVSGREVSAWFVTPHAQVQQAISEAIGQLRTGLGDAGYILGNTWVGGDPSGAREPGGRPSLSGRGRHSAATAAAVNAPAPPDAPIHAGVSVYA